MTWTHTKSSLAALILVALAATLSLAAGKHAGPVTVAPQRLELLPLISDKRLEDIQEAPGGKRLITHDRGFAPRLWDPRTMQILRMLGGRNEEVFYVTFSFDGSQILTLTESSASIWDSAKAHRNIVVSAPEKDKISAGVLSRDNKWCALGTASGKVGVFQLSAPKSVKWVDGHSKAVIGLDTSPDSTSFVTASTDKKARVWRAADAQPVTVLDGHTEAVRWAWFSEDGKQILTTALDNKARLFDSKSGKLLMQKEHVIGPKGFMPNTLMSALFVGKGGSDILVAEKDGTMAIYDRLTGAPKPALKGHTAALREIRKSRDGLHVATYGDDEKLKLWDVETAKEFPFTRPEAGPTAGEFSPDGEVFWVGYRDGSFRRHELRSGSIRNTTLGSIRPIEDVALIGNGDRMWVQPNVFDDDGKNANPSQFLQVGSMSSDSPLDSSFYGTSVSPDGSRMLIRTYEGGTFVDTVTGKPLKWFKKGLEGCAFSGDSKRLYVWYKDGWSGVYDTDKLDLLHGFTANEGFTVSKAVLNHDGTTIFGIFMNRKVGLWDSKSGQWVKELGEQNGAWDDCAISLDGKWVATSCDKGVRLWNTSDYKETALDKGNEEVDLFAKILFSEDGKSLGVVSNLHAKFWDIGSGRQTLKLEQGNGSRSSYKRMLSNDGRLILMNKTDIEIWDYRNGTRSSIIPLSEPAHDAFFSVDSKFIVTNNSIDGLCFWTREGKRISSLYMTTDNQWLVMDTDGRYDAKDPSNVKAAAYVMEWDQGLEPIDISQLKAQFYEPDLLAKSLGFSKESIRPVSDISGLRLFPEVSFSAKKETPFCVDVSLKARDNGGVGKVAVFLNGKQVLRKEGVGYLNIDALGFEQYLLPEPELKGHGNLVSVQAWNEDGTLASPLATYDIGVPTNLKTPPVSIYALAVGVGDYAGQKSDLKAPPQDVNDFSKALQMVGNRLLPDRVHVTTLTTAAADPASAPTRANITKWFDDASKSATSSDIVLIFFSGHGTDQLGKKKDYFFLTKEADPSDVNEATATTGAVSGEELRTLLNKIAANKQVVILDTCHSGAAASELISSRSVSGDYQRAWESIKDSTGTWLLAGTASDQLSYESSNVDHGMLTYSLLEAIDKATGEGLRKGDNGELYVDVEQWFSYAAARVDSLKSECGVSGIQHPELKRSSNKNSFALGVTSSANKGAIGLKPPMPVVILGTFEQDSEDPIGFEAAAANVLKDAKGIKVWTEVSKHPSVFRVAGTYTLEGEKLTVKVVLQKFDSSQNRKTLETFELSGTKGAVANLANTLKMELEKRVPALAEKAKKEGDVPAKGNTG